MAPTLTFVPGFMQRGEAWEPVAGALAERYRVRCLDFTTWTFEERLEEIPAGDAVVGYSMGGRIALHAGLRDPGAFASLALVGGRTLWRLHPAMQGVLAYLALCLVNYGFVYYGQYRYRMPMEPFMILVATPFLARLWADRRRLHDEEAAQAPPARGPAVPA